MAPGTVASALTAALLWLLPLSAASHLGLLAVLVAVGTWAAHRAETVLGRKDPGPIVIDEVAGMTLAVLAMPLTPAVLGAGLLLFRLFDITKPPPAGAAERLPGGLGVMADDLVAGVYALGVLAMGRALLA